MLTFILSLFMFHQADPTNYGNVVDALKKISSQYSQNAEMIVMGDSDSGLPIYALKIGNGDVATLVVATHHGNEYGSTAVAVATAESLAADPLPGRTVYVVPVLNISGYNTRNRNERTTKGSFDPNRDYPGPCGTNGPFRLKSTTSLAKFLEEKNIVTSATLHTYSPAVLYPWGISTQDLKTEYESTFIALTQAATVESKYQYGNSTEILYAADGTFEDYAFWKTGAWSILFEMGYRHNPGPQDIEKMIQGNVPGIRRLLAVAPIERAANHNFTGKCDRSVPQRLVLE
jgi:carboxypeptidase T